MASKTNGWAVLVWLKTGLVVGAIARACMDPSPLEKIDPSSWWVVGAWAGVAWLIGAVVMAILEDDRQQSNQKIQTARLEAEARQAAAVEAQARAEELRLSERIRLASDAAERLRPPPHSTEADGPAEESADDPPVTSAQNGATGAGKRCEPI